MGKKGKKGKTTVADALKREPKGPRKWLLAAGAAAALAALGAVGYHLAGGTDRRFWEDQ